MAGEARRIWWTRKAVLLHSILLILVPSFVALFWWQVQRVRQGNGLSWAYVFEWPFFLGYAVYLWWKLVHEQDEPGAAPAPTSSSAPATHGAVGADAAGSVGAGDAPAAADDSPAEQDEELAAYNRYLAQLHESGRPKRW